MRTFQPGLPYYTPLTDMTMRRLFTSLFSPFARGQSSTFIVKRRFGGGRACLKFLLSNVDEYSRHCRIPVSTLSHCYIYIDPDELRTADADSYERYIFSTIGQRIGAKLKKLRENIELDEIQKTLWSFLKEKDLVLVLAGMSFLEYTNEQTWSRIRLLQVYPEKVHFLFVLYDGAPVTIDNARFSRLYELMNQNIVQFDHLSPLDVEYSIDRWSYTLECSFNESERREIRKSSLGYPSLLKVSCFAMANRKSNLSRLPLDHHRYMLTVKKGRALWKLLKDNDIEEKLRNSLSACELDVLDRLAYSDGSVVSRDNIASIVWGSDSKRYSDAAITQMIRRMNRKMVAAGVDDMTIHGVYRQGYRLCKEHRKNK